MKALTVLAWIAFVIYLLIAGGRFVLCAIEAYDHHDSMKRWEKSHDHSRYRGLRNKEWVKARRCLLWPFDLLMTFREWDKDSRTPQDD